MQDPVPKYETTKVDLRAALAVHESEQVIYLAADVNITDISQDIKVSHHCEWYLCWLIRLMVIVVTRVVKLICVSSAYSSVACST